MTPPAPTYGWSLVIDLSLCLGVLLVYHRPLKFPTVIIDEASQASEPATLVPITQVLPTPLLRLPPSKFLSASPHPHPPSSCHACPAVCMQGCEQLVLVGDHYQLPPTIKSFRAAQQVGRRGHSPTKQPTTQQQQQ